MILFEKKSLLIAIYHIIQAHYTLPLSIAESKQTIKSHKGETHMSPSKSTRQRVLTPSMLFVWGNSQNNFSYYCESHK